MNTTDRLRTLCTHDGDEELEALHILFPNWKCECKRLYAFTPPWDAEENPVKCPTCGRVYNGDPWFWTWTDNQPSVVAEHDCWPKWYECKGKDAHCILCDRPIIDPYEFWNCPCKEAYERLSQDHAMQSPLHCEQCDRVWDGHDWYRSLEFYNTIVLWENLSLECHALLNRGESPSSDTERWALELMDYCDTHLHMDSTVFWKLDRALHQGKPQTEDERATIEAAHRACFPIMDLIWHRAKSRPSDPEEWPSNHEDDEHDSSEQADMQQRSAKARDAWVLRPQQLEIVHVIREAGRRLTMEEILAAIALKGSRRSEGWAKNILSPLVQFGVLTNGTDSYGRGYGLPEWESEIRTNAADNRFFKNGQSRD